jgi:hypothetical protein
MSPISDERETLGKGALVVRARPISASTGYNE